MIMSIIVATNKLYLTHRNQFGIGQRLPAKDEAAAPEVEKTKARIQQSIEYMQTVWTDDKYSRVRHKCKNQHEE